MSSVAYTLRLLAVFTLSIFAFLLLTCGEKTVQPQQAPPPGSIVARFGASTTSGATPLTVVFTDSSTGTPDFWFWRFGDGKTSFDPNPFHVFETAGTFTVILVVSRDEARDSLTKADFITVEDSASASVPIAQFSATPLTGSAPLSVQFTNTSFGTITSYAWRFGDGATSTAASPGHVYTDPGTYAVRLIVNGPGGADTLERVDYIVVAEAAPVAAFTASPTSGQPPLVVVFDNQSTGTITDFKWYFGDGDSSTVRNPGHSYESAGSYAVTLIVVGPGGSDTLAVADFIAVSDGPPIAAFTGAPTSGIAPLTVQFTDNSAGVITSYQWSFGDGGTSTTADPIYQYAAAGIYTVSLIVVGPGGSDSTLRTDYVSVQSAPPVADFVGAPTTGIVPFTVTFTNQSTGDVTGYQWSFGDGGTSSETHPAHQYVAAGVYSVRLITTGPGGADTLLRPDHITANLPPPVASFSADPVSGVVPLSAQFTSNSTGQITAYNWTFGDGASSTLPNPLHTYLLPGQYDVQLIVAGPGGADTLLQPQYITVSAPAPVANFTADITVGNQPLTVHFSDQSSGDITSWSWRFGQTGSSTQRNPSFTFATAGVYDIRLIVVGPGGTDTLIRASYINVLPPKPVALFTGSPTLGDAPLTVNFVSTSTGSITAYEWDFGDGEISSLQDPSHLYAVPGVYDVQLKVTGPGGSDSVTQIGYITVNIPRPVADFSAAPLSGVAPLGVQFTSTSTGEISTYSWTFGDGSSTTISNPFHTYDFAGEYDVRLIVEGPGGADTLIQLAYVNVSPPPPIASFEGTPTSGVAPLTVQFTSLATGDISSHAWSFGDGGTSIAQNPTYEYTTSGTYTVTLRVVGPGGEDSLARVNYISVAIPPPTADFTGSPLSGTAPLTVTFTNGSSGLIDSYLWDFGDGGSSSLSDLSHIYLDTGTFSVTLVVAGPGGADTLTFQDYIKVESPLPVASFSADLTTGVAPLLVQFTNSSTGTILSQSWDFGDGGASIDFAPSHQYQNSGVYTVTLALLGPSGVDTLRLTDYITVLAPQPVPDFSADQTTGVAPLDVQFTDLSTGAITTYEWDFGDSTTSAEPSPLHTYISAGTYSVKLTVTGPGGSNTTTKLDYITVTSLKK